MTLLTELRSNLMRFKQSVGNISLRGSSAPLTVQSVPGGSYTAWSFPAQAQQVQPPQAPNPNRYNTMEILRDRPLVHVHMQSTMNSASSDAGDTAVNAAIEVQVEGSSTTLDAELEIYREFIELCRIEAAQIDHPSGRRGLCEGRYQLEAANSGHVSGVFMERLLEYYRTFVYRRESKSFTEFLSQIRTVEDFKKVMNLNSGMNEAWVAECLRRFLLGVRYLTPEKRAKYNVTSKGATLYWAKWGDSRPLSTVSEDFFARKDGSHAECPKGLDRNAIWVLSRNNGLYTHPSKVNRFHHSSFVAGNEIVCGGDWEVNRDGKLQWISASSGHYKPTFDNLARAVGTLATKFGISANSYKVKCAERRGAMEAMIPANRLLFALEEVEAKYKVDRFAS